MRNLLVAAYTDLSQVEVAKGEAEHVIYSMDYDDEPKDAERVAGLKSAQGFFERTIRQGIGAGGGTNFTAPLVKAFETIAKHEAEGGEIQRANLLMNTDGNATVEMDKVLKARSKVSRGAEISFNAITIGDGNDQLKELAHGSSLSRSAAGSSESRRKPYHFIGYDRLNELFNPEVKLKGVENVAKDYGREADATLAREKNELIRLKQKLVGVESEARRASLAGSHSVGVVKGWLAALSPSHGGGTLDTSFQVFLDAAAGMPKDPAHSSERAEIFEHYVEVLRRESRAPSSIAVLKNVGVATLERIRKWLEL